MSSYYLKPSHNRAYLASCLRHSAQIPLRGTSDTLETLGEMADLIVGGTEK